MALADGCVAYWKQDESSGDLADATGNGYTMTNNGSTAFAAALINNGTSYPASNTTDFFRVASDLTITGGSISISIWVKLNAEITTSKFGFIRQGDSGTHVNYALGYDYNGGTRRVYANRQRQNTANNPTYITATLGTTNWNHLVLTYNGTTVYCYLNTTKSSGTASSGNGSGGGEELTEIGLDGSGFSNFFSNGLLDEAGVWNRALSDAEVAELYNSGAGIQYPFTAPSGDLKTLNGITRANIKTYNGIASASWKTWNGITT